MKTWQKILLSIAVLLACAAAYIFWPAGVWPFVPHLDYLADAGDPYDARILRDTYGVPHIFGQTDADAAYGLAYAHAEDDFLTIQQTLLAARGKLGTVYGRDAAPNDYMVQLFRIWDVIDANYDTGLQPQTKAILDGYAAGINQYAALHPHEVLNADMFPVTGKDIVAGFVHKTPLFYGVDHVLSDLFADERKHPVSQKNAETSNLPITTRFGSNTFAVSPLRSANGETFLAVNSHQPWTGPVAWYEAHVHSEEGWNTVGGLFPGAPVILVGHNDNLGWALTVNDPDLVDVYVLDINPDNPNQYRFDGEWLDLEVRTAPITVKLFGRFHWTVKEEVLWSVYGPTVRRPHGTYALRFAGYGKVDLVQQWYRLNKATNFDEWRSAMRDGPLPMFNAGYADKDGNIFYVYNALLPIRAEGYDWEQYLPGSTSETLWTDYLPFDDLPQVLNPASGFIQNANSTPFLTTTSNDNPDPAAYSSTFGIDLGMSNRALHARELFGSDESITENEFIQYKFDMGYSKESDIGAFVAALRDVPPPDDADMEQALGLLQQWDLQTNPESEGATIGVLLLYFLHERTDLKLSTSKWVGHEVPTDILLEALGEVTAHLREHYGRINVPWGEVNRLRRGDVDLPLGGAPDVLHAIYGEFDEDGRLHGIAGDAYILIVTWDANGQVHSQSIHQFGSATQNTQSMHYADQSSLFSQRKLKPVWLTEADIRANLEQEYHPGEEINH